MKRLAMLLPDGVGVRNHLLSGFLDRLEEWQVDVFQRLPPDYLEICRARVPARTRWFELQPYPESQVCSLLRYALHYGHMYWADTRAMRFNLGAPIRAGLKTRVKRQAARVLGRTLSTPTRLDAVDRLHQSAVSMSALVSHYESIFRDTRPAAVFCSHQRPPEVLPVVLAARRLGIPTATFIFSWDNLTSKGRIAAPFDYYFVWSALMRDELVRFYPQVSAHRIEIVGTPQFDVYADRTLLETRQAFLGSLGADPDRPLVCYSGGDAATCPDDPEHVRILLELIRTGRVAGNPQVVVRPSPVDDGRRYASVRAKHPELLFAQPRWNRHGDWAAWTPFPEDVTFLANLTHHADLNVNVASTMTLDFAIHDRPIVNVAFDASCPPPLGVPIWDSYYHFDHYSPVLELEAARAARSPTELADQVNRYLADPTLDREGRRRLVELQLGAPLGTSSQRFAEALSRVGGFR